MADPNTFVAIVSAAGGVMGFAVWGMKIGIKKQLQPRGLTWELKDMAPWVAIGALLGAGLGDVMLKNPPRPAESIFAAAAPAAEVPPPPLPR